MPPALKEAIADKKESSEKKDDKEKASADKKDEDKDDKEKSEFSDVITSDYLDWMENTLKSGGVDIDGARAHFDDLNKANLGSDLKDDGAERFAAQVKGRVQENGAPSTNAISRTTGSGGKKDVKKSDFLTPDSVSDADVEAAYEVYKAAAMEQEFRGSLESTFANRFANERQEEIAKAQAQQFDARGPLDEVMKALNSLNSRIDAMTSADGTTTIAKSANTTPQVTIPSTQDMHKMSWDEVHALADRAFDRGE